MKRFGENEFLNNNDSSVSVSINDGVLREFGVPNGELSEGFKYLYVFDSTGQKIKIPFDNAMIEAFSLMDDKQTEIYRNKLFCDINIIPSEITGITPWIIPDSQKCQDVEFLIYGRNMNVNETTSTKLFLKDENTNVFIESKSWHPINNYSVCATFNIPKKTKSKCLRPVFVVDGIELKSIAEVSIKTELSFENVDIFFIADALNLDEVVFDNSNIEIKPLYRNDIGSDCISVMSKKLDKDRDFIVDVDLSLDQKDGGLTQNYDFTRSGIGLSMFDACNGNSWLDSVNLDVSTQKPHFGTFFIKDNVRHVKFIKQGNSIVKMLYTDYGVSTTKMILTPVHDMRIVAKCQRLDVEGTIKSLKFSNIRVNYF